MSEAFTLRVRNAVEAIAPANESAEAWLSQRNMSPDACYFVLLAMEELITNCIKYGYDDDREHIIEIVLSLTGKTLTMTVVDDGHPFDPLSLPPPDMTLPIEDRPIGGLGVYILRKLADELTYERRDNTNRVTLTKHVA